MKKFVVLFVLSFALPLAMVSCGWAITIVENSNRPVVDGVVGQEYWAVVTYSNYKTPYYTAWTLTGSTPPGVNFDYAGNGPCIIKGTPTQAGKYTFTLSLTDTVNNEVAAPRTFTINISGSGGSGSSGGSSGSTGGGGGGGGGCNAGYGALGLLLLSAAFMKSRTK